ncbi:rhamnogalacturonan acetylesterase [Flavobacterium agrisoli]|uniref:rhamnogalacturonan acetylesterase n=1 Tax=Flavobacterium agrisoli TaxID=2793066 RepID=UPI0037423CE2
MKHLLLVLFIGAFSLVVCGKNFQKSKSKPIPLIFNFEANASHKNKTAVLSAATFSNEKGFGFDFETENNASFSKNGVSFEKSTYFSIAVPEGNYAVTVKMGNEKSHSEVTIKAESKRVMVNQVPISKGNFKQFTFNVNIRNVKIDNSSVVQLKDREKTELNWDDKLTLEFLGNGTIQEIEIKPISNVTTVFLAGDSTVTDQDVEPWASWGQMITSFFDTNVVVANYASSGASLKSFKGSNRFKKILSQLKKGDYVFIEFGHNDEKHKGEENSAWNSYSDLLVEFTQQAQQKGGEVVLVTPTQRRAFNEDKKTLRPTHGDFPDAMRAVAKKLNVPLIDLTEKTTVLYEKWGNEPSRKAFVQYPANTFPGQTKALEDNTHFNDFGANEIALCVIEGIRDLNLPLKKCITKQTPDYSPSKPNYISSWTLPLSSRYQIEKPDGN